MGTTRPRLTRHARPARVGAEPLEHRLLFAASTVVINTDATGPGSLAAALTNATANAGPDVVSFAIPGVGVHRITVNTIANPLIGGSDLVIDGTTQPGYVGAPLIEIVGTAGLSTSLNNTGLSFVGATNVTVRGLAVGGFGYGIELGDSSRLEGCYIGLAANGAALANSYGVVVHHDSVIGGIDALARNVISGNTRSGVYLNFNASGSVVLGNYIGTDPTGTIAVKNQQGIEVSTGDVTIGGDTPAARNVISGNPIGIRITQSAGIYDDASLAPPVIIRGNYIGLAADGLTPIPNGNGIENSYVPVIVGGTIPGQGNVIAYNLANGVEVRLSANPGRVGNGQRSSIRGNSIFDNAEFGIDLANDGITPNDPLDADTGPNQLQNYPVVATASADPTSTVVAGSLDSTPNATFTLDFYASPAADPFGYGEGKTYLGSATVTTDANGHATYALSLPAGTPPGQVVAATATAPDGATSEFSLATWVAQAGDANRDRKVDFADLTALAQNYNTAGGRGLAQGDFTGDGAVDFNDLVKLAQNYNTGIDGPVAGAAMSFDAAFALAARPAIEPALRARPPSKPVVTPPPVAVGRPPLLKPLPIRRPEAVFSVTPPIRLKVKPTPMKVPGGRPLESAR